jgi:hypothetical protein
VLPPWSAAAAAHIAGSCAHFAQMLVAGVASLACFSGGPIEAYTVAIYPLQVNLLPAGALV